MTSLKFLVVDDAAFIRDMLKKQLRDNYPGCQVFDAANGKKAQVALKGQRVDLILCDWEMPEMSGEEFLHWVRGHEVFSSLPFIMVTSRGEKKFIIKAAQAGVSDFLGKPFNPETLVGKVNKALRAAGHKINEPVKAVSPFGSADILTKAPASNKPKPKTALPASDSASLLTGGASKTQPKPSAAPKAKSVAARGQAQLNFADFKSQCVISSVTLQTLNGAIKRGVKLPAILAPVVISIVQNDGDDVARLNGYVHSIQAAENRIDANVLKLVIRFVDDDPVKLEQLSRYISTL